MKTKKLFTLAALLTSSLASAVDLADLENKYYVGLNFGGEYSGGLNLRPNLLIGYHYKKSSKLELEINSSIHSLKNIGIGLLANYPYYPDIDLGPATLYVSGGLGSYIQIIGEASSGGDADKSSVLSISDEDKSIETASESPCSPEERRKEIIQLIAKMHYDVNKQEFTDDLSKIGSGIKNECEKLKALNKTIKEVTEATQSSPVMYTNQVTTNQPSANKILGHIAYKLKIGVDYKFTPRIIGAVGLNLSGSLNSLSQVGTGIEVGIRYNF
ncbi:hypothetical protein [Wolbachia endosymbiont (group E) of Neria commutata]|uniref:hypothetical protein n=1 Tax=Wolbachia endosymbiont (group E) of Neria commutata TaxID=3066149 RepID=UPI003132D105